MGQVEHRVFAKKGVSQTQESFEDHIERRASARV